MNKFNLSIETKKNLLAFSAGVDSTALFFILVENNIPFDIAIIDYKQREQAKEEISYAKELSSNFGKKCFIKEFPENRKFSEKSARDFRYDFFEKIINEYGYETLITAHQLNDKLEWFLMQFTKGAGLNELLGLEKEIKKNNYILLRPLLDFSKEELQNYLERANIKYFIDHTNYDEKYKRNFFRHNFSDKLLKEYKNGILNSFGYLKSDIDSLMGNYSLKRYKELHIYRYNSDINTALRIIDKELKKRGVIISKATREEIKNKKELVVSHKISLFLDDKTIWIAPKSETVMDKDFKERCRVNKIPKNIRAYLFDLGIKDISSLA